jgi:alkylation response protein AidB-like acyl-CoA dehydrogenase
MEFGLSSEQTLLRDTLDHYLRERAPLERVRRFAAGDEGRARDLVAGLAELGVSALLIPSAHGGIGMTALDACVVAEALGYHVTPVAFTANAAMVPSALLMAGSATQQADPAASPTAASSSGQRWPSWRAPGAMPASRPSRTLNGRALCAGFPGDAYLSPTAGRAASGGGRCP